jgi:hypothetical protein
VRILKLASAVRTLALALQGFDEDPQAVRTRSRTEQSGVRTLTHRETAERSQEGTGSHSALSRLPHRETAERSGRANACIYAPPHPLPQLFKSVSAARLACWITDIWKYLDGGYILCACQCLSGCACACICMVVVNCSSFGHGCRIFFHFCCPSIQACAGDWSASMVLLHLCVCAHVGFQTSGSSLLSVGK